MLNKTRRLAAAAIVLPTVLTFAACGKSESPSPGTTGASKQTSSAPAAHKHFTTVAELKSALTESSKKLTTLHLSMKAGDVSMEGDVDKSGGKSNLAISMKMDQGTIDVVLLDGTGYLKGFPGVPAGKWVSAKATDQQMAELVKSFDLTTIFSQFADNVTAVKYVSSEKVDGVDTDKYELTITEGSKTEKGYVWVDDKDMLRKAEGVDDEGKPATGTFTKIGEPVTITAPPAADVTQMPSS